MKFKTSELTGDNLNHAVALAQGWLSGWSTALDEKIWLIERDMKWVKRYNPEQDWAQCGELIEKFNISLTFEEDGFWSATCYDENTNEGEDIGLGETAQQAICRCVVASVYGDEVEL